MKPFHEEATGNLAARILIVDDDASIRELFAHFLKQSGYHAEAVPDGEQAVGRVEKDFFDLILLDLVLPGMSGQDTFEMMKAIDPAIPVIIVTGYGSIENAVEFLKNGVVDYLAKPVHFEEFKFRVNRALEEKRLKRQAITDLKTQLFNHNYFEKRLNEELGRAERYGHDISLLMVDLDNFKRYNDTYGHVAGDQVLREVGAILKRVTRDCDIPCRFGGEEFSVILPETDSAGALKVAERIRNCIENGPFDDLLLAAEKGVTASIGAASCRPNGGDECGYEAKSIIERADKALYEAKRRGRNSVCSADNLLAATREE